jgi:hypothetical protein
MSKSWVTTLPHQGTQNQNQGHLRYWRWLGSLRSLQPIMYPIQLYIGPENPLESIRRIRYNWYGVGSSPVRFSSLAFNNPLATGKDTSVIGKPTTTGAIVLDHEAIVVSLVALSEHIPRGRDLVYCFEFINKMAFDLNKPCPFSEVAQGWIFNVGSWFSGEPVWPNGVVMLRDLLFCWIWISASSLFLQPNHLECSGFI